VTSPVVAVLAGRGKTGQAVTAALESYGARAHPVGRELAEDPVAALAGARAVYLVAPNMCPDEPAYVARLLHAATRAGVERVVYHSVAAPYAPDMPHHLGKARAEDLVRRSGLVWSILQPCAYVQNFVPALARSAPRLRIAYDPDSRFGLVDLHDVAEAAARALLDDRHAGATYELGGPALVSVRDVAGTAAELLGRHVPVERLHAAQWAAAEGSALGAVERQWLLAMFAYYDRYGLSAGSLPLEALLGRPGTDLRATLARELGH
jgi:uncharacterized protein YbjT (DUF2867 family)